MHINAAFLVYLKRISLRCCTAISARRGIPPKPQRRRRRTGFARHASPDSGISPRSCTAISARRSGLPKPQRRRRRSGLARRVSPDSGDGTVHIAPQLRRCSAATCAAGSARQPYRYGTQRQHAQQSFGIPAQSRVRALSIWRHSRNPRFARSPFGSAGAILGSCAVHLEVQEQSRVRASSV